MKIHAVVRFWSYLHVGCRLTDRPIPDNHLRTAKTFLLFEKITYLTHRANFFLLCLQGGQWLTCLGCLSLFLDILKIGLDNVIVIELGYCILLTVLIVLINTQNFCKNGRPKILKITIHFQHLTKVRKLAIFVKKSTISV